MNPYERWDDWEWEKAVQEVGHGREGDMNPPWKLKRARTQMKQGWGSFLNQWSSGQRKTVMAALVFLTVFASSTGGDVLSRGIHRFYQTAMTSGDYYPALTTMAKGAMGLGGVTGKGLPVDAKMQGKFQPPLSGPVVAGFGQVANDGKGTVHQGIDVGSTLGTPVVSPFRGIVVATGVDPQMGNFIKLDFGDGWSAVLGNLGDVPIAKGQKVEQGEIVGTVGLSAPLKQPWLHFELRKNDKPLNPLPYLIPPTKEGAKKP